MKKLDNVLLALLKLFPDKSWNWNWISRNENIITWEIIQENPDKPWNWFDISRNENIITWEIIQENPDKPWIWFGISWNKNITLEIIKQFPDKPWDWYSIGYNNFNFQKRLNKWIDYNARIIQNQVKHWLWSALNGKLFLKEIKKLQEQGYLN